jgi:GH15 family glucan-1,4-alpha-glucosidase
LADYVAEHWCEPDFGLWENRGKIGDYTYSRVMCWVALDSAIALAKGLKRQANVANWQKVRQAIQDDVKDKRWDDGLNSFVSQPSEKDLDASILLFPLYGFIKPGNLQMYSTFQRVKDHLRQNGMVYKWKVDGQPLGDEGASVACTSWLAMDQLVSGRPKEAKHVFDRILDMGNELSLYSEEIDPPTREFLGNYPYGPVHAALINLASDVTGTLGEKALEKGHH